MKNDTRSDPLTDIEDTIVSLSQSRSADFKELLKAAGFRESQLRGTVWRNVSFADQDLTSLDFRNASFHNCSFKGAKIAGANFRDAVVNVKALSEAQDWFQYQRATSDPRHRLVEDSLSRSSENAKDKPVEVYKKDRGLALGREEAMKDPRVVISERLYIPRDGEPDLPDLNHWELPIDPGQHPKALGFEKLLRQNKLFVVGGLKFVRSMGLLPAWYNDSARRKDAVELIEKRGWQPIFDKLEHRDLSGALISQDTINKFFRTIPAVDRVGAPKGRANPKERWADHLMRLRKAIEFITLTEAVVAHRFSIGESFRRFAEYTGIHPSMQSASVDASVVWDYLYIKPVLYQVDHRVGNADIHFLQGNPEILSAFANTSGQSGSLDLDEQEKLHKALIFWTQFGDGATGTLETIKASADAANLYRNGNGPAARAVTVDPYRWVDRIRVNYKRIRMTEAAPWNSYYEDVVNL